MEILPFITLLLVAWFFAGNLVLLWMFRSALGGCWKEPCLLAPIVIFESDDWGPGPLEQAHALKRLRHILSRYSDAKGHHPTMTLGLTLAAPDVIANAHDGTSYSRKFLDHPDYAEILEEICLGIRDGVFAAQLHGMEHYLPSVLLDVAGDLPEVKRWLTESDQYTELLPKQIQSRWMDGRVLPSSEHDESIIEGSISEEVSAFRRILGVCPSVEVPNTFVWTKVIEKIWASHGIRFVVTCGKRFVGRDEAGDLVDDGSVIWNGLVADKLTYLVRDAYFEPARGHNVESALSTLQQYINCARPLLFETHRFNFTSLNPNAEQAFEELDRLLGRMLDSYPEVRFMSTEQLGEAILSGSNPIIADSFTLRLRAALHRANSLAVFRRYGRLTGMGITITLFLLLLPSIEVVGRGSD